MVYVSEPNKPVEDVIFAAAQQLQNLEQEVMNVN
jgi:hypothetical protein